jgi:RNA polymerase sigma-70 factor (ECF subfamily)
MATTDKARDEALALRLQAGDEAAFEILYRRHSAPLRYYLRRVLGDADLADDAGQAVWLQVLRGIGGLRRLDRFLPWLYRIARNEALQDLRKRHRAVELQADDDLPAAEDDSVDRFDDAATVHAALDRLKPLEREALTLRFVQGLTYTEMAEVLGCPEGTVRSRLHYAKCALKKLLGEKR